MPVTRTVRRDGTSLFVVVDLMELRPPHTTLAQPGMRIQVLGPDPARARFGSVRLPSGHRERWVRRDR